MKRKCINWAIVTTMERPDGTWFTDTITEVDKETSTAVDEFLTKYVEDEEGEENCFCEGDMRDHFRKAQMNKGEE